MGRKTEIELNGETLHMARKQYGNGRMALLINDADNMPYTRLTMNIPDEPLANDEIIVKDYDENEELAKAAYKTGLFRDTGRKVKSNWTTMPVWKILDMATIDRLPER